VTAAAGAGGVVVAPASSDWPLAFEAVRREILRAFDGEAVAVAHAGSTAVPGLDAKPIIDVLLGAASLSTIEAHIGALAREGFAYVPEHEDAMPMRRYFVRAADAASGRLRVNLHAVVEGSTFWREHLAFRDALRADASLVARYAALKHALAARHRHDRPAYTDAKAPFIRAVVDAATGRSNATLPAGGREMSDVFTPARVVDGPVEIWSPRTPDEQRRPV
jgi:GrpB-like predicted nucleotidyltransferase (UPF0157 family)